MERQAERVSVSVGLDLKKGLFKGHRKNSS